MSWVREETSKNGKRLPVTYYDVGYAPLWNPALVADLVELLTQPDVQWFELEEMLDDAPREAQFVRLLRANRSRSPYAFEFNPPRMDFVVDEEACQILLHRLFPYATLLDTHLSPLEQAMQLHREGVDVESFLTWLAALGDRPRSASDASVYSRASHAALQSWHDHYSLLRGAERIAEPANHLLRAAHTTEQTSKHLLLPGDAPSSLTDAPSHRSGKRFWPFRRRRAR